jgi:hypothetical protein
MYSPHRDQRTETVGQQFADVRMMAARTLEVVGPRRVLLLFRKLSSWRRLRSAPRAIARDHATFRQEWPLAPRRTAAFRSADTNDAVLLGHPAVAALLPGAAELLKVDAVQFVPSHFMPLAVD